MTRIELERVTVTLRREPTIDEWVAFALEAWDMHDDAPECLRRQYPEVREFLDATIAGVEDKPPPEVVAAAMALADATARVVRAEDLLRAGEAEQALRLANEAVEECGRLTASYPVGAGKLKTRALAIVLDPRARV